MTSAKALNRHLVAVVAEMTGTKYCRACNGERSVLDKHEFAKFVDMVDRVAAQAGVFIPMREAI